MIQSCKDWDAIWCSEFGKWVLDMITHVFRQCGHGGPSIQAGKELLLFLQHNASGMQKFGFKDCALVENIIGLIEPPEPKSEPKCYQCKLSRHLTKFMRIPRDFKEFTPPYSKYCGIDILCFGVNCWDRLMTIKNTVNYIATLTWGQMNSKGTESQFKKMMVYYGNMVSAQQLMKTTYKCSGKKNKYY
jgi:hypothetical protein